MGRPRDFVESDNISFRCEVWEKKWAKDNDYSFRAVYLAGLKVLRPRGISAAAHQKRELEKEVVDLKYSYQQQLESKEKELDALETDQEELKRKVLDLVVRWKSIIPAKSAYKGINSHIEYARDRAKVSPSENVEFFATMGVQVTWQELHEILTAGGDPVD